MGRHATPELDAPTEVIALPNPVAPGRYVAEGRTDFATWWQSASAMRRTGLGVLLAVPVVVASAFFVSESNASAARSAAAEASSDARAAGAQHANDLRDAGYDGLAIQANCLVASDGHGSYTQQYENGCVSVALRVMQTGR